jgi:hypothetical protein
MAYKALSVAELLALMKQIQGEKTNTEFAADLGISKQYLTDVYNGRKTPSSTISSALGFETKVETLYVPFLKGRNKETQSVKQSQREKTKRPGKRDSG